MEVHATFAKQLSVKYEDKKQRKQRSCWEGIVLKLFGRGNTVTDMSSAVEPDTLEDGTVSEIIFKNSTGGEIDLYPGLLLTSFSHEEGHFIVYRHVLKSKINGHGNKLNIKDGDEIIIFGANLVLTISHADLLKKFYNLRVDGQSTFEMTIRRKINSHIRQSGKWKWLNMFVILSSCDGRCKWDSTLEKIKSKTKDIESENVYKVPGTQRYVQIDNSGLCANTMSGDSGDKTKVICRRAVLYEENNELRMEVTLRDKTLGRHISFCVESQQIVLSDKPQLFKYSLLGDNAHFLCTEGYYLGYDSDTHEMRLQREKFAFEELPVPEQLL